MLFVMHLVYVYVTDGYTPANFIILIFLIACFIILFFLRSVLIQIDNETIIVKLRVCGINYKHFRMNFDKINYYASLNKIDFVGNNDKLTIEYDQDSKPDDKWLLYLEMYYNGKKYQIGNRKNSFQLFNEIKNTCSENLKFKIV